MSKVFLLSSNTTTEPYPVYPLGMAVVASALAAKGYQVHQFDFLAAGQSISRLRNSLCEFNPDFIGISIRNIDSVDSLTRESDWYLATAKLLVEVIREETSVPIIVGGPAFSIMPDEILDYMKADYGVVGEGERSVCDLIHNLENGCCPPRLLNGSDPPLIADEMCSPLLEEKMVHFYREQDGMFNLQTKRGCPHNCLYCTYPVVEVNQCRCRDPKTAVDDLERMKIDYGVDKIFFTDSVFNDEADHYLEVAEELLSRNLSIRWSAFFRPQGIRRKDVILLKNSGLYAMEVGTDGSSDTTLAGFNKQFRFSDVIEFNRICIENEMPSVHFVMFGGPDETEATIREGLENLTKLEKGVVFAFSGIRIFPGTGLHLRAIQDGVLAEGTPLLKPVYYFSPHIDPDAMNAMLRKAFHGRWDRLFPPSQGQKRMAVIHSLGSRGLLLDRLISFSKKKERFKKKA